MKTLRGAKGLIPAIIAILTMLTLDGAWAGDVDAKAVMAKTLANYAKIKTYQAEGKSVTVMERNGSDTTVESAFTIKLGRPRLYNIDWTGMMNQKGAVWNAGDGAFLYMGMGMEKSYSKQTSDEMALAGATGISGGAANTIPSIFFPETKGGGYLQQLTHLAFVRMETLDGEECYVITGQSAFYAKHTIWISKARSLFVKMDRSFEQLKGGTGIPEMTDDEIDEVLKQSSGTEMTAETKKQMREMIKKTQASMKDMKGTISETHTKIQVNAELGKEAFAFGLPVGAKLKDSLF